MSLPGVPATGLPVGTLLTYNATLDSAAGDYFIFSTTPLEDLIAAIKADLASSWDLTITTSSTSGNIIGTPTIQIIVQMSGPKTYGQPDDIRSIIDGEIINQTGGHNYIAASNISSFTLPPSTVNGPTQAISTGAAAVNTSVNPLKDLTTSIASTVGATVKSAAQSSGITGILKGLQTTTIVIILAVIVGVILLVAYKPESVGLAARSALL